MTRLDSLFRIEYGNKFDKNKLAASTSAAGIAFVGRKGGLSGHSGVSGFVQPVSGTAPYPAGLITVALGGSRLLSSYVQQQPFYTAQNVAVLSPVDIAMPLTTKLYYAMCIRHNAFRYTAFGREANRTLRSIDVPDEAPQWAVAAQIPALQNLRQAASMPEKLPRHSEWTAYRLDELFSISKGKRVPKAEREPGSTPFIGATEFNNGITDFCSLPPNAEGHCLTVAYNGSVGSTFFQPKPFFACDDINILRPRHTVTSTALLFIGAVIRHERIRFTYGYKWTLERMRSTVIRLPGRANGSPDYDAMTKFMLGLPFSGIATRAMGGAPTSSTAHSSPSGVSSEWD